jgi:hypothetical protein
MFGGSIRTFDDLGIGGGSMSAVRHCPLKTSVELRATGFLKAPTCE